MTRAAVSASVQLVWKNLLHVPRALPLIVLLALTGACGEDGATGELDDKDAGGRGQEGSTGGGRADAGNPSGTRVDAGKPPSGPNVDGGTGASKDDSGAPPKPLVDSGGPAVGQGDAGGKDAASEAPSLPPVDSTDVAGPFATKQELMSGPSKTSGIFRPSELGKGGVKHPIFVWGCGGTATPASYADQLNRIASHGFVVVGEVAEIGDNGVPLKASIDWILAENERTGSVFYQHLDTSKVALGGHSIGSVNSFYIAADPRLATTIHVAGGSLDNVNDPFAPTTGMGGKKLTHPVAYVCSASDIFGNVEKTEKDYTNTTVPAFMTTITGADHTGAAREGLPVIIAWLRWHLAGESSRRASFLDPKGTFGSGKFVSKNKNW